MSKHFMLTDDQIDRYSRQILTPQIGVEGQRRLLESRVAIVGLGGLGATAASWLAAAGVGRLDLIDPDVVELSNLQRQVLYALDDVGKPKAECAAAHLHRKNPEVHLNTRTVRLDAENGPEIAAGCDVVIDGTDDFDSRLTLARVCHASDTPWVFAGVRHFEGQVMTILPGRTACHACVFPPESTAALAQSCADAGVFGPAPAVAALIQASEAVKLILGIETLLAGRLLTFDLCGMRFREVRVRRRPDCPVCGRSARRPEAGDRDQTRWCH